MHSEIIEPEIQAAFDGACVAEQQVGDCPDAELLWSTLDGSLDIEARQKVLDHCARCPACAEELRVTKAFFEELQAERIEAEALDSGNSKVIPLPTAPSIAASSPAADDRAPAFASVHPSQDPRLLKPNFGPKNYKGLAAVTAMAAIACLWLWQKPSPPPNQNHLRGAPVTTAIHGVGHSHFRFENMEFHWPHMGPQPQRYRLVLTSEENFLLIREIEHIEANHFRPDPDLQAELERHKSFYWTVISEVDSSSRGRSSTYLEHL